MKPERMPFTFRVPEAELVMDWLKTVCLALYLPDLNLLDFGIQCIMYTKINATARPYMDCLKLTIQQEWVCLTEKKAIVQRTAARSGLACRILSLLMEALSV